MEMQEERDAAGRVKRDVPVLVVIGNPPYNAYAGLSPAEEWLVKPYKEGLKRGVGHPQVQPGQPLRALLPPGRATHCRDDRPGHRVLRLQLLVPLRPLDTVMRRHLLASFDAVWIDSLNGDSRETGKTTPEGRPDPSVFSTEYNREGIRVGTAIGLFARRRGRAEAKRVGYRESGVGQKCGLAGLAPVSSGGPMNGGTPHPPIAS